jgi:hypothetical protein
LVWKITVGLLIIIDSLKNGAALVGVLRHACIALHCFHETATNYSNYDSDQERHQGCDDGLRFHFLQNVEREHPYQLGHTSITG